jgi:hypothetical protein
VQVSCERQQVITLNGHRYTSAQHHNRPTVSGKRLNNVVQPFLVSSRPRMPVRTFGMENDTRTAVTKTDNPFESRLIVSLNQFHAAGEVIFLIRTAHVSDRPRTTVSVVNWLPSLDRGRDRQTPFTSGTVNHRTQLR